MQETLFTQLLTGGTTGIIAGLVLVILGLVTGRLVPGYLYKALEAKLTRYEDLAYKAMTALERASKDGAP